MTEQQRMPEPECYYVALRHPDGRWYRLWMTNTEPKTGRGHPWHVHANYDLSWTVEPRSGDDWFERPYGISNWDFNTYEQALDAFLERFEMRLGHGYAVEATNMTDSAGG